MALFGTALIISAEAPPHGAPLAGTGSHGAISALVDTGSGPQRRTASVRFSDTHWLVPGMQVPVLVDPGRPDTFEVRWEQIPPMADRVAAGDPALADPVAASARVAAALGVDPASLRGTDPARLRESLAGAAALPPPPGWLRAVVVVVSARGRYFASDPNSTANAGVTYHRAGEAVLAVYLPGRPPYPVLVPDFKVPKDRTTLVIGGYPALVSAADGRRVDIQWAETQTTGEMINDRIAASTQRANEQLAEMAGRWQAAAAQATAGAPGGPWAADASGAPAPGMGAATGAPGLAPGAPSLPPQMREALLASLRNSLRYVRNPAQRQMILDQYRLMGLHITPEELGI